jgi:L-2-hydroxycarboxylate dehydrogenase (NAD+)
MLPGQLEATFAVRSQKAGGLLFSKAEVEAFNEIASHIGHQPFDLAALPTG